MDKKSLLLMVVIVLVAFGIYFYYEKFAEESPEIRLLTCGCDALGSTERQQEFYDACEAAGGIATIHRYTSDCGKKYCTGTGKCGKGVQCSINVDGVQYTGMNEGDCTPYQTIY